MLVGLLSRQVHAAGQLQREVKDLQEEQVELESELEELKRAEEVAGLVDMIMIPTIESADPELVDQDLDEATRTALKESGQYIGCGDQVVFEKKNIEPTARPLEAIYLELFQERDIIGLRELDYEEIIIENSTAQLHLSGQYVSVGTCEPPRTEAVLEFAAKQYPHIDDVEIYLDGEILEFVHGGP